MCIAGSAEADSNPPAASDIWVMDTPVSETDVETARREIPGDVCFTAAALMAKALHVVRENPQVKRLHVPYACNECLLDGLSHTAWRLCGTCPEIVWEKSLGKDSDALEQNDARSLREDAADSRTEKGGAVRVGIVGNPLLCFDAFMNDGVVELLRSLGCEVAMPESARLFVEDVRYLDQLDVFAREGVDCVIYLQSFGCMKACTRAGSCANSGGAGPTCLSPSSTTTRNRQLSTGRTASGSQSRRRKGKSAGSKQEVPKSGFPETYFMLTQWVFVPVSR